MDKFTENALTRLKGWGYIRSGENVRVTPALIYDTQNAATGTTDYNFFNTNPSDLFLRNRQLPLSGDEALFIDKIRLTFEALNFSLTTANIAELLCRSYLAVIINDVQKIKLPLWEIANFNMVDVVGTGTTVTVNPKYIQRERRLQFPIMLYKRANVRFQVVLSPNAATAINATPMHLELSGIKSTYIEPNFIDPVSGADYERLSTTLYDTQTHSATATTYSLFSNPAANPLNNNKVFPLPNSEVFSVEAIEVLNFSNNVSGSPALAMQEIQKNVLKVNVDDVEYWLGSNNVWQSLLHFSSGNFNDAGAVATAYSQNNYITTAPEVLGLHSAGVPFNIPSQANVSVTLQQAAQTRVNGFIMVMFKGTLVRRLA